MQKIGHNNGFEFIIEGVGMGNFRMYHGPFGRCDHVVFLWPFGICDHVVFLFLFGIFFPF
jgi:hypothetical protein